MADLNLSKPTDKLFAFVLVPLLSVGLILLGIIWAKEGFTRRNWPSAQGTIIDSSYDTRHKGYDIQVAYSVDGRSYTKQANIKREIFNTKPDKGTLVVVVYNPSEPGKSFVKGTDDYSIIRYLSAPLGVLLLASCIILAKRYKSGQPLSGETTPPLPTTAAMPQPVTSDNSGSTGAVPTQSAKDDTPVSPVSNIPGTPPVGPKL